MEGSSIETINCPYCRKESSEPFAEENGFIAVKCSTCAYVYVNPRPARNLIDEAVQTGVHRNVRHGRTAIARWDPRKVVHYCDVLSVLMQDVWGSNRPIRWLDVGAGYGELVEAVTKLAPRGSLVEGLEPMQPKVMHAKGRGINLRRQYLGEVEERYEFLSLIDVFSHIPDFRAFLNDVGKVLLPNGELVIQTGNIGELSSVKEVQTELDLPDHLVFAGAKHLTGFLSEAGYSVVETLRFRRDGLQNFVKLVVKKALGRKVNLRIPYTSPYRSILIRARRNGD